MFAFVGDLVNEPLFHTDVLTARKTSPGPVQAGTTYELGLRPFRGIDKGTATVTRVDPGRMIEFENRLGSMRALRSFLVEPQESGSFVTHRIRIRPTGMMRLMSPLMRNMIGKSWTGFLANLKEHLEGRPAPASYPEAASRRPAAKRV